MIPWNISARLRNNELINYAKTRGLANFDNIFLQDWNLNDAEKVAYATPGTQVMGALHNFL